MKNMLENLKNWRAANSPGSSKKFLLGIGLLLGLVSVVGCAQGSYPLDIFYEMHYQDSFKAHEPPRLSVPETAVGWFPPPPATSFAGDGRHLYQVNCSMCHGQTGEGNGPVLQKMMVTYGYEPVVTPNLRSEQIGAMGVLGVQGFMGSGLNVMPNFSKLMTDEEMRLTAEYVINCLQEAQPEAC